MSVYIVMRFVKDWETYIRQMACKILRLKSQDQDGEKTRLHPPRLILWLPDHHKNGLRSVRHSYSYSGNKSLKYPWAANHDLPVERGRRKKWNFLPGPANSLILTSCGRKEVLQFAATVK